MISYAEGYYDFVCHYMYGAYKVHEILRDLREIIIFIILFLTEKITQHNNSSIGKFHPIFFQNHTYLHFNWSEPRGKYECNKGINIQQTSINFDSVVSHKIRDKRILVPYTTFIPSPPLQHFDGTCRYSGAQPQSSLKQQATVLVYLLCGFN